MSARLPFLLEIGVEEIPHWMIQPALAEFGRLFRALLDDNRLTADELKLDATPRRLVLRTPALQERQEDRDELVLGPPTSAGPNAAAGFARKNNVAVETLATESTPKGAYYALHRRVEGRAARDLLAEALPALITKIPWPKAMYWTGKDGPRFIRPIRWMAALLSDQVVEFELAGVHSGALSSGHRRLGAVEIAFDHADYEERLERNGVILSAQKRRKRILDGIRKLLKGTGLTLVADDALLDDLVYLTEYPTPILGAFDEKFLVLPREVLTTVMRHHQRYFTLQRADTSMAPSFIAVMNMRSDRKGHVRKGNERVLEARFNDARFFWSVDQQKPLARRVDDLKHVTFQARLGSYYDKTQRCLELARDLGVATPAIERALELAKCDLTTEMVKELTGLQGVMGGLYAQSQGEPEAVWRAIYEHYKPAGMEDSIPSTCEGCIVSLVDKLDTLYGCFGIGLIPSGSKDPFALRRAAQGVVKILVEGKLRLLPPRHSPEFWEFFLDRVRYYFREVRGFKYDEVNAVLASQWTDLVDAEERLFAVKLVRQTEHFEPLAAAFKRIRNILRQAEWTSGTADPSLLVEADEKALYDEVERIRPGVKRAMADGDYIMALKAVSSLRPAVDRFFDGVLVNAPDARLRANRLSFLGGILNSFSSIADFSEIVTESTE
jgi:glycyl-tRNA synthetase beta chain